MTTKPQAPDSGTCPTCGGEHTMVLAEDLTQYSKLAFEDGKWVKVQVPRTEPTGADESIRMFCTTCGEYFIPTEELCQ